MCNEYGHSGSESFNYGCVNTSATLATVNYTFAVGVFCTGIVYAGLILRIATYTCKVL